MTSDTWRQYCWEKKAHFGARFQFLWIKNYGFFDHIFFTLSFSFLFFTRSHLFSSSADKKQGSFWTKMKKVWTNWRSRLIVEFLFIVSSYEFKWKFWLSGHKYCHFSWFLYDVFYIFEVFDNDLISPQESAKIDKLALKDKLFSFCQFWAHIRNQR